MPEYYVADLKKTGMEDVQYRWKDALGAWIGNWTAIGANATPGELAGEEADQPGFYGITVTRPLAAVQLRMRSAGETRIHATIPLGEYPAAGLGPFAVTYTVTANGSGLPLSGVTVQLADSVNEFNALTDLNGQAVLRVPGGSYSETVFKSGYTVHMGTRVVSANVSQALGLAAPPSVEPPEVPGMCNVIFDCDREGLLLVYSIYAQGGLFVNGILTADKMKTGTTEFLVDAPEVARCIVPLYPSASIRFQDGTQPAGGIPYLINISAEEFVFTPAEIIVPNQSSVLLSTLLAS